MPRMPYRFARRFAVAIALGLIVTAGGASPVAGQVTQQEQGIWRLDQPNRAQIEVLFDSATRLGLPAELLYSKTLEGISKGVSGRRIVEYMRKYFSAMVDARNTLGTYTIDEVSAATAALLDGVERQEIVRLRKSRGNKSIAVPLIVLGDLVKRGVPTGDASLAMVQLSQRGALDSDFQGLWVRINQDIVSGVPPAAALQRWTRDFSGRAPPPTRLPPGATPAAATPGPLSPETPSSTSP